MPPQLMSDAGGQGSRPTAQSLSSIKLAYRIPEAVAATGISRTGLYRLIKAGEIATKKFGTSTLIERSELERVLKRLPPGRA